MESRRGLAPHGDGVGVLEAEGREPPDAEARAELARHLGVDRARVGGRPLVQDREQAGAGVLGIDVDRAAPERGERDLGGAEPQPALDAGIPRASSSCANISARR